jgi:hypothetical protein
MSIIFNLIRTCPSHGAAMAGCRPRKTTAYIVFDGPRQACFPSLCLCEAMSQPRCYTTYNTQTRVGERREACGGVVGLARMNIYERSTFVVVVLLQRAGTGIRSLGEMCRIKHRSKHFLQPDSATHRPQPKQHVHALFGSLVVVLHGSSARSFGYFGVG